MSGFDRIKAPAKRLSERDEARQPDSEVADTAGRAALFSASGVRIDERARSRAEPAPPAPEPDPEPEPAAEAPTDPADGKTLPTGKSLLQVECGHCGITCPMPLGVAVKRAFPLAVLVPMRSHPVFATCPCGERRAWLKPTLGLPK